MSTLVLWRHARTGYNNAGRLQGSLDVPLGAEGLAQARRASARLVNLYGRDLVVSSSPLERAAGTARVLADLVGVEPTPDAAFTQRSYGAWEGLTWDEVRERWPEQYVQRRAGLDPDVPGWGSSVTLAERVAARCEQIWDEQRTVVVCSHGGAIMHGTLGLLGVDPLAGVLGHLPHGAWNVLERGTAGEWSLAGYSLGVE